jgi:hypothetical protein
MNCLKSGIRVKSETDELPEEWINLNLMENVEIDRDDKTIQFMSNDNEFTYDFKENEADFIAIQNALKGIKVSYQEVNDEL